MRLGPDQCRQRPRAADHGVLATLHATRGADLVPVCFVVHGDLVAVPVDRVKPKDAVALARARNLESDPRATLLCEHWDAADWDRLWWVRASLVATPADPVTTERFGRLLQDRYPQYTDAVFDSLLVFRLTGLTGWTATPVPAAT